MVGGVSLEPALIPPCGLGDVAGWVMSGELFTSLGLDFLFYKYMRIHSTVAAVFFPVLGFWLAQSP